MSAKSKCHIKALTQTLELLIISSVIALIADTLWVFKDIHTNGINTMYALIASGLIIGTGLTMYAGWLHHTNNYKDELRKVLKSKLAIQRAKRRAKKL